MDQGEHGERITQMMEDGYNNTSVRKLSKVKCYYDLPNLMNYDMASTYPFLPKN